MSIKAAYPLIIYYMRQQLVFFTINFTVVTTTITDCIFKIFILSLSLSSLTINFSFLKPSPLKLLLKLRSGESRKIWQKAKNKTWNKNKKVKNRIKMQSLICYLKLLYIFCKKIYAILHTN